MRGLEEWRRGIPMAEEIATETWEDVNSISVFGKNCAFEFVVCGDVVVLACSRACCDEAVVMSIVACYLSNHLQGYSFSRQPHLQIFKYFLSFFSKTSVYVMASSPIN